MDKILTEQSLPLTGIGIAALERDIGVGKDTLRVWERRYGFPKPHRDAIGERVYPADQVERVRLVKHIMARGHRVCVFLLLLLIRMIVCT